MNFFFRSIKEFHPDEAVLNEVAKYGLNVDEVLNVNY